MRVKVTPKVKVSVNIRIRVSRVRVIISALGLMSGSVLVNGQTECQMMTHFEY